MDKLMRVILPFEFEITRIDSTFKLGQNKSQDAIHGAAEGLEGSGIGSDQDTLAALMRAETTGT